MHAVRASAEVARDHSRKGIDTHSPEWLEAHLSVAASKSQFSLRENKQRRDVTNEKPQTSAK